MYKAIVRNILTGKTYLESIVFETVQDAQDKVDNILAKQAMTNKYMNQNFTI